MKIAVIGAGISGLGSAYLLSQKYEVDLYEKESRLGGHARTTQITNDGEPFGVDTGFLVFNYPTYPLLTKLFEKLDVKIENSDMSFGFWDTKTNAAYNAQTLKGIFFQKRHLFSVPHYKMIWDILKFNKKANRDIDTNHEDLKLSLGEYIKPFGKRFKDFYLLPMGAAIWSTPSDEMLTFPAYTFMTFFKNHGLLGVTTQHQWLTVSNGSINYVKKVAEHISGKIVLNSDVVKVRRSDEGAELIHQDGSVSHYDRVIFATHAPDTLKLLEDASIAEKEILGAFGYKENTALLHNDETALYPDTRIFAAWNYKTTQNRDQVTLSYWINRLQNLVSNKNYFVSLNDTHKISNVIEMISYDHPQFTKAAIEAQTRHDEIDGVNHTHFTGAYWRYGFHEDGLWSASQVAAKYGCAL